MIRLVDVDDEQIRRSRVLQVIVWVGGIAATVAWGALVAVLILAALAAQTYVLWVLLGPLVT